VEATRHYQNLYAAIIGKSAKARKGTSLDRVLSFFESIDSEWLAKRKQSGIASGEGLIQEVRDPVMKLNPKTGDMEVEEQGERDKGC
jgi:hypothetical protein